MMTAHSQSTTSSNPALPGDCPFCSPPREKIIHEHSLCLVLRDAFPVSLGHTLIVPRRHVSAWREVTREEKAALLELVDYARGILDEHHAPDGYNIGLNDGIAAGQTVMHVHVHVIPRYAGDEPDPRGGVRRVLPHKAAYWKAEK